MDGGAYCTLTPGRPVARRASTRAARTAARTSASGPGRRARTRHPTARSAGSGLRRPSSRPRRISTGSPSDSGCRPSRSGGATSTARATPRRPARSCATAWPGEEVLERAAEAAEFTRLRERTATTPGSGAPGSGAIPGSALRTDATRIASGIGLALAWHGAGFTGSGEVHLASVASIELTAEGAIRILTASTEMGQGTKTIFPQLVAEALGVPTRRGRDRAAGHGVRARLRARPLRRAPRWSSAGC